jgi:hypothetical protein
MDEFSPTGAVKHEPGRWVAMDFERFIAIAVAQALDDQRLTVEQTLVLIARALMPPVGSRTTSMACRTPSRRATPPLTRR